MNFVHVLAVLLALVGATPAVTLLSPIKVAHRSVPGIMIVASLVLWFLPTGIDLAMACVPVAAWISARLGIEHAGHEALDVTPAVAKAKSAAQAVRDRVRKPEPVEITEFITADSAGVLRDEDDEDAIADDEPGKSHRPELRNQTITNVPKYVPQL